MVTMQYQNQETEQPEERQPDMEFIGRWKRSKCGKVSVIAWMKNTAKTCLVASCVYVAAVSSLPAEAKNACGFIAVASVVVLMAVCPINLICAAVIYNANPGQGTDYKMAKRLSAAPTVFSRSMKWLNRFVDFAILVMAASAGGWWFVWAFFWTVTVVEIWFSGKLLQEMTSVYLKDNLTPEFVSKMEGEV